MTKPILVILVTTIMGLLGAFTAFMYATILGLALWVAPWDLAGFWPLIVTGSAFYFAVSLVVTIKKINEK